MSGTLTPIDPQEQRACVFCGRCLEACPLFAATGREELAPRSKFALAQALEDQDVDRKAALALSMQCLGCGRCEKVCPSKLCAPSLVSEQRAANPNLLQTLWKLWVSRAGVLWPMMTTLSRFAPEFSYGKLAPMLGGLKAMDVRRRVEPWLAPTAFHPCGDGRKAVLFPGCVASHVQPHWTSTAKHLLAGLGFDLPRQPDFTCCACTLGTAGLKDQQRAMRLHNVQAWRDAHRPQVVVFCATCRCGLRAYADADLGWQPGERDAWLRAVTPLAPLAARIDFAPDPDAPRRGHYHTPCHGAGGGHDLEMLQAALGPRLSARTRKNLCCGFGGSLKLSAPDLSAMVGRRCMEFYAPDPGDQLLTGCSGCVIQLRASAPPQVEVGHWLEVIRTAS